MFWLIASWLIRRYLCRENRNEEGLDSRQVAKTSGNGCARRSLLASAVVSATLLGGLSISLFFGFIPDIDLTSRTWLMQTERLLGIETECSYDQPPLVIISLDGFARDYLDRHPMSSFDFLEKNGVKAEYMIPSFQSKTFPNHYTMVTGLYPGYHGIIDAIIYDEEISDEPVDIRGKDTSAFYKYGGEPIWALFRRLTGRKVAVFQWPGTPQYPYYEPDFLETFDGAEANKGILDRALVEILKEGEQRKDLIMVYMNEPDHTRHKAKADSPQIAATLKSVDEQLGRFFATLEEMGKLKCTNVVVLSDHGFMDINRWVNLTVFDIPSKHTITGVVTRIHKQDNGPKVEDILKALPCDSQRNGFRAFDRIGLPPRFHFTATKRAGDMFLLAEPGAILDKSSPVILGSNHGWDPTLPEMRMIFYAMGPDFQKNKIVSPFQNVEVFNLLTELLRIRAPTNNGTLGALSPLLKYPKFEQIDPFYDDDREIPKCPSLVWKNALRKFSRYFFGSSKGELVHLEVGSHVDGFCYQFLMNDIFKIFTNIGITIIEKVTTSQVDPLMFNNACSDDPLCGDQQEQPLAVTWDLDDPKRMAVTMSRTFIDKFWLPLQRKTAEYGKRFGRLLVITGTTGSGKSGYLYRLILRCDDVRWDSDYQHCLDPRQMRTLTFLAPLGLEDYNCLDSDELLSLYSARIRDVETISGLHFFKHFSKINYETGVQMKTNVTMELW